LKETPKVQYQRKKRNENKKQTFGGKNLVCRFGAKKEPLLELNP